VSFTPFPPEKQEKETHTVLEQAKLLSWPEQGHEATLTPLDGTSTVEM
jgi:hypothetical protein